MTITIYGNHTAPYGDFPYHKGDEFERALKRHWGAVTFFQFTSIDTADVSIDGTQVLDLTGRQVHVRLAEAVKRASDECNWHIWSCPAFEHIPVTDMPGDEARALLAKVIDELREIPFRLEADLETGSPDAIRKAAIEFGRRYPRLCESFNRLGALTSDVDLDQLKGN